jgi:hypothetical protein
MRRRRLLCWRQVQRWPLALQTTRRSVRQREPEQRRLRLALEQLQAQLQAQGLRAQPLLLLHRVATHRLPTRRVD